MAKPEAQKPDAESALTPEQAAKRVGLPPDQYFAHRDYGTHVVVVTVDGKKLDSREAAL